MKNNTLHTVNRWNKQSFLGNVFDGVTGNSQMQIGKGLFNYNLSTPTALTTPKVNWSNPVQRAAALGTTKGMIENFGKEADATNAFGRIASGKQSGLSSFFSNNSDGLLSVAGNAVGGLGYNLLSNGYSTGVGSGLQSIGSTVGGVVGAANPLLGGIITAGSSILGGGINALWGEKVDEKKLAEANAAINDNFNYVGNASTFEDITGPVATASVDDVYKGGIFNSSADRKNEALKQRMIDSRLWVDRSINNNVQNLKNDQLNFALGNYAAYGGAFDQTGDMGAIDYGFMTDYLTQKKRENDMKGKMNDVAPMPAFMPNSFDIGGDLQTNGADFSDGLTIINAGSSHEENPYEGVQLGTDENGTPNLVEEGETIYNDYVFSARIPIDATTKELFHIGKKREMTYADLSKKLEKEIAERVNDPISKAGFEKQMQMLEEQQERQKQEMEAERAKAAFEALSPEEQTALMRQRAEQEAMQEAAALQQPTGQPTPEEIAMAQQQQMMADGSEAALGQEPQMNCFGGKINRFDEGGRAYTKMLNSLGFHTQKEFDDWAKENNIDLSKIWDTDERTLSNEILSNLWKDDNFKKALKAKNPALAHAFSEKGYDWGAYQPASNGKATIQSISKGNWKTTTGKGWRGSDDLAFRQATEGLSDAEIDALTTEQLAERMRRTTAYQNTNKWLQNSDNALQYLNTLISDPGTPEVAREYARKFVKDGKWKDGFNYDYATVFGSNGKGVRETNPGTYWHTALEANRGNQAGNFVINEDGTIEPIVGDVPTDWTPAGNYTWSDEDNDYAYNYYKRPVVTTSSPLLPAEEETSQGTKDRRIRPVYRNEGLRYAGLFGPAVGLGMQMAGIGRPNLSGIDAAVASGNGVNEAKYKPLGNYLTYRPMDIWFEQNRMDANARATDRAIMNASNGNTGAAMAGLLANSYNNQIADGQLYRQALEYNDAQRQRVADFNRGTDQYNSDAYMRTSQFNANARNQARQHQAQMRLHAANERLNADQGWYNSIYGNVAGIFKGIGDLGRENYQHNRIADMAATGIFGSLNPDNFMSNGYLTWDDKKRSNGGKINRKKGGRK